jgi:hypothetical protein
MRYSGVLNHRRFPPPPTKVVETYGLASIPASGPIIVNGMFGIGDNLHQRAVVRELMKTHEVWLDTCHVALHHDLVEQGLKLRLRPTSLHAQARTIATEAERYPDAFKSPDPPAGTPRFKLWYNKVDIDRHGSIMAAMFGVLHMSIPARPDFSLPIRPEWSDAAQKLIDSWNIGGKPLMLYRPVVLRAEWNSESRNPDEIAYAELYQSIRDQFFVVSIADLKPGIEWIVGKEADADVKLHKGELDFETMAALFHHADLVFANAGFGPVLAQAVGTPSVVVYGGRESFKTTDKAGDHLAPTLGIDPINPCDCHSHLHACDKRIDVAAAKASIKDFVEVATRKYKVLVFGTTYVDSEDRVALTQHWNTLHSKLNPLCDLMLVDSASPSEVPTGSRTEVVQLGDNIGHLSRHGRDGWGRAFCRGLQEAIDRGYDYAVHIEGDSLLRLPVMPIIQHMKRAGVKVASVPVTGMRREFAEWVETGLMFFDVAYLKSSQFIQKYDWPNRQERPTPEIVIRNLLGEDLTMMPWRAWRGDKNQITKDNIATLGLDWMTHCHNDSWAYDRFVEGAMAGEQRGIKVNFGCGTNRLPGWTNVDSEVDITKPLPYASGQAQFILAEHVVEHTTYHEAVEFFKECRRILRRGGVLRVVVPSVENIWKRGNAEYFRFTTKWQPDATLRGALHNIVYCHGHRSAWTDSLLEATLILAGFDRVVRCDPRQSTHRELRDVDGHWKVIGERANWIESCVIEASS